MGFYMLIYIFSVYDANRACPHGGLYAFAGLIQQLPEQSFSALSRKGLHLGLTSPASSAILCAEADTREGSVAVRPLALSVTSASVFVVLSIPHNSHTRGRILASASGLSRSDTTSSVPSPAAPITLRSSVRPASVSARRPTSSSVISSAAPAP